ncbi:hypothetical protein EJD97_021472 [Solanum chilense]|uniref:Uncharacterized protein n=1 Tax=Solanum chilense TaxID=4083 RepID=A0A6N2AF66_SOLCI|nr:hypothetical protein EJD97_021472 [Solanum chilense]
MSPFHKLVFEVVHKGIIPRGERIHEANFRDMGLGHALDTMRPINWPSHIIKHMVRIVDPKKPHQLAYGNLLTTVFKEFGVPLKDGRSLSKYDMLTQTTLAECNLLDDDAVQVPLRSAGPVTALIFELNEARAQNVLLKDEVTILQAQLAVSHGEVGRLKDQLIQQQIDNNARVDHILHAFFRS